MRVGGRGITVIRGVFVGLFFSFPFAPLTCTMMSLVEVIVDRVRG